MTSTPPLLRVVRPYRTKEEFLASEAWAIAERSVVLVGAPAHPEGAEVTFELVLMDGTLLVGGDGVVAKCSAAHQNRQSAVAIRVQSFAPQSLDLIKHAEATQRAQGSAVASWTSVPPPPVLAGESSPLPSARPPLARSASIVPAARRVSSVPPPPREPTVPARRAVPQDPLEPALQVLGSPSPSADREETLRRLRNRKT